MSMIQPTTETEDAWFDRAATEPPAPRPTYAERIAKQMFDQVAERSRLLVVSLGEHLLRHELKAAGGAPFYCARESQFPTPIGDSLEGYQHPLLDLSLRPTLERLGEWRSRGPAVVLNDRHAFEACRANDDMKAAMVCIGIHEICHCVEYAPFKTTEVISTEQVAHFESQLGGKYISPRQTGRPPWHAHEANPFLRVVIHAVHRVRKSGLLNFPLLLDDVFFSAGYARGNDAPRESYESQGNWHNRNERCGTFVSDFIVARYSAGRGEFNGRRVRYVSECNK
jgi:hypothetical protein